MATKKYTVSDGEIILTLREDEKGWYIVTSPTDPAMVTQARSIPEAFKMARDAFLVLGQSRNDPGRWEKSGKPARRRTA